ncbi:MAG: ATP-binding cassette domain-containing protein, partial [Lachnospiraceae bacterium]|nr:ATP-binding cassette domain-containing protein [Lachnospiraceae bacterium]
MIKQAKPLFMMMKKGCIILFWLLVWHVIAVCVDNPILLATPWETLCRLVELCVDIAFWKTICVSLGRISTGFVSGMLVAFCLAGLSSRLAWMEELLRPVMMLGKTIPVASFVVILLIWWGSSVLATAIAFLMVLPNIYISTLEGIRSTDEKLLEMARVFGLPCQTRFFYIYRPALYPFLQSSFKLALGMCWKSGVAAEVIGMPDYSIGGKLYFSKIHLDTSGVFAWTVVIILLSIGFEKLVLLFLEKFFAWEPRCKTIARKQTVSGKQAKKDITLTGLTKCYGEEVICEGLNQQYQAGQTYYLDSPSGSGKTTLLKMLAGLESPSVGEIHFAGNLSMVFQEDRLCESYSALRNVEMITGDRQRAKQALLKLLDKEAIHKPVSQLSGGMKRRVALVRAMEADSDCVLLDEPFTGMDEGTRMRAKTYIQEKKGTR